MNFQFRYILAILLLVFQFNGIWADSLRVSVLTCSPGTDVYAHFGHTAIRVMEYEAGHDVVFNYGCFDYTENMFIYKFIKGETDYVLEIEDASFFFMRYENMGVQIDEQVLNVSDTEKQTLVHLLVQNLKPENKQYRYNYLYDNCTTRARDMIERAMTEEIEYDKLPVKLTAREELAQTLDQADWLRFGINLLLGHEIDDKNFGQRNQMFIPSHYMDELDSAYMVMDDGTRKPLVSSHTVILNSRPEMAEEKTTLTPTLCLSLLLILSLIFDMYDIGNRCVSYWFDIVLSLLQGLSGLLISFLFFFSVHPAVDSNWLIVILNPIYLLYAVYLLWAYNKRKSRVLTTANMVVLTLFSIMMFFVPQTFDTPTSLLVIILMLRSVSVHVTEMRIDRKVKNK